jgi:hypothetical protein
MGFYSPSGEVVRRLPVDILRGYIQHRLFPGPLGNLPPHGKPVAGIAYWANVGYETQTCWAILG